MQTIFFHRVCNPHRPPRPPEREAHRAASGDGASLAGAPAQAKPPGLCAAVRQTAAEDDRSASDRHRPRSPHAAAEEDGGGHVPTPTAAGDHEGLVLELDRRKREVDRKPNYSKTKKVLFFKSGSCVLKKGGDQPDRLTDWNWERDGEEKDTRNPGKKDRILSRQQHVKTLWCTVI